MSQVDKIEQFYLDYEKKSLEVQVLQFEKKALKEELIAAMKEAGVDDVTVNGIDGLMQLTITFPEREVLNKKELAKAIGLKQKDFSRNQDFVKYVEEGLITLELIMKFTLVEEREMFLAQAPSEEKDK